MEFLSSSISILSMFSFLSFPLVFFFLRLYTLFGLPLIFFPLLLVLQILFFLNFFSFSPVFGSYFLSFYYSLLFVSSFPSNVVSHVFLFLFPRFPSFVLSFPCLSKSFPVFLPAITFIRLSALSFFIILFFHPLLLFRRFFQYRFFRFISLYFFSFNPRLQHFLSPSAHVSPPFPSLSLTQHTFFIIFTINSGGFH